MTSFYFIADNSTQVQALEECGVKNVSVSYKFVKKNIKEFREKFNSIILNPGSGKRSFDSSEYNEFVLKNKENYSLALQYDEPGDTRLSMSYYHQALEQSVDGIIPILHEDYRVHLNYIKPIIKSQTIALGRGKDIDSEDKGLDDVQGEYQIHGLGKSRWIKYKNPPNSVDSPTWLNPVKNGKLSVVLKDGGSEISIRDIRLLGEAIEENKDYAEKCGVKLSELAAKNHKAMLKSSLVLYYMPKFRDLGILEKNFVG